MASYRVAGYRVAVYRPARPYRRPRRTYKFRYRARRQNSGAFPVVAIVGAVLLAGAGTGAGVKAVTSHHAHPAAPAKTGNAAAAAVVAFAKAQVGKVPYLWGGTTEAGMDCSGLSMEAYAAAHVSIERTSQDQWASEKRVPAGDVVAGDLVFFAGSDGTPEAPGHVGIVVNPKADEMIDEYETGTYAEYDRYGAKASPDTGLSAVVGFTDPDPAAPPVPVAAPAGGSEAAYFSAVLADLKAPATAANLRSLTGWYPHEYRSWPPAAENDALDTTLRMPGSWPFNTFDGGLHVQAYPTASEGAQATAATLEGGYPLITAALRSGDGACGKSFADEFGEWSGYAYQEVC
jgi:cell wall-associated NlpC family hydrolase